MREDEHSADPGSERVPWPLEDQETAEGGSHRGVGLLTPELSATVSERTRLGRVEVAPGLFAPVEMHVDWEAGGASPYRVVATIRPVNGRLEAVDVMIVQVPGGPPVARGGLVKVPITDIVACAAQMLTRNDASVMSQLEDAALTDEEEARLRAGNPGDAELQILARAYRIVRTYEPNPTSALQAALDVHPKALSRWLAKAEAAGYLTPEERGRRRSTSSPTRTARAVDELSKAYQAITEADLDA